MVFRIADLAEGNPLLAEELRNHVIESELTDNFGSLASSIEEVTLQRFSELDESDRESLKQAAVPGRSVSVDFLTRVVGVPFEVITEAIVRASQCGLLSEDQEDP